MTRTIPTDIIVPFLIDSEGEILRVYDDKHPKKILKPGDTVDGVLTAGVGKTGGLKIGQAITKAMSRKWLMDDLLHKAAVPLEKKVGADVIKTLTDHQYAALLSFVFNLGTGDPAKTEWTIWKRLRALELDQIPLEMMKFVNWNGKKSSGLVKRRADEVVLWSTEEPGSDQSDPPSSVTRVEATPPTPADPTSPAKSATVLTSAAGAVAAVPVVVSQVSQAISPYADASDMVKKALGVLAIVAAVCAAAGIVLMYLTKRKARN